MSENADVARAVPAGQKIQGGQGRDDEDMRAGAEGFGICLIGAVILLAFVLLCGCSVRSRLDPVGALRDLAGSGRK